jgi:phosphoribosylaminoimidazole-succinocarboxamide synthase
MDKMKEFKPIKEGKVREVYDNGDSLIISATDRISAFDVILKNEVKDKGAILTQMSKFWFNLTENTVPNHMISTDVKDMPEFFQNEKYAGRSMMCKKLEMFPVECIVRGYHRKRLGKLPGERNRLRYQASRRITGI